MLKKTLTATLLFFLAVPVAGALAQTGTLTGIVTDSTSGDAVPGVNIRVVGTQLGTSTDPNGEYDLDGVPAGNQQLSLSFVGYRTKTVPVDVQPGATTTRDIQLASSAVELSNVVVTALGVEREERSLGYGVSEVEGEDIDRTGETNFVNNLSGKVSGARVNTSSGVGGSSRIVLRGDNSITGENEPLFVVDGVPLDNSNFNTGTQNSGSGGYDFGNAASQISPSDIESVTVLKGPAAAALYGTRASNGVIEITTKSGAGQEGLGVTVQQGLTFSNLYNFENYQSDYGGGGGNLPFAQLPNGDLVPDYATDESWGPPLDGRMVREWFSWDDVNGKKGQLTPWDAHPDNIENMFETGQTWNTNVSLSQGGDNFNYRTSVNNVITAGVSPGSSLRRTTLSFKGSLDLTDRLTTSLSTNYIDENRKKTLGSGYSGAVGPFQQFNTFGQRQIDLSEDAPMNDLTRPDGTQRSWNWKGVSGAQAGIINFANNPFWTVRQNFPEGSNNRIYGKFSVAYDLLDDLTLSGNIRTDQYTQRQSQRVAVGSVEQSSYREGVYELGETNFAVEMSYDTDLSDDFSLQALGGTNYRYNQRDVNIGLTAGGLSVPNLYTLENSVARPSLADNYRQQGLFALYADATLGWRDLVYIGGSVRNDWSSTLPEDNNSYIYPSVRGSFVFSSLPALADQDVLSYGKVRLSWAQVGSDTDPYSLSFTYPGNTPFDGIPLQSLPNSLPNTQLEPEIETGYEVGTQLQFFNNRIGIDATYYRQETENQIFPVGRSAASGFTTQTFNTGTISNEGVELQLDLTPVLADKFRWDLTVNWATNQNEVETLPQGRTTVPAGVPPFGPSIVAQEGEPLGSFFGNSFARDENGNKIITGAGTYQLAAPKILGSFQPDWTYGASTTVSYAGLSASVLVDGQKGGKAWSLSNLWGLYSGLIEKTTENDVREVGLTPEGVVQSGTDDEGNPTYKEFTGTVPAINFFKSFFGNHEANIYSLTHVKLREVSIGYTLPRSLFGSVPVQGLTISAIGRDLATLYKESPNFDPTAITHSSGIAQGVEAAQLPPSRSYGLRLRLTL